MAVTEVLQALGSWELRLGESTPDYVIAQLGYFGHVAIVDGPVDVAAAGNALLAGARYVGVCRDADHPGEYVRGGSGLLFWVGDEDGKGYVIETQVGLTSATLAQVVTALLPPTVTVGTVFAQADSAVRYTGKHIFQTPREALAIALAPFGAEIRVNPNFTVDVGTAAQLYNTATPDTIIKRRGAGADVDLTAIGGDFDVTGSAVDTSTRVVLLGQTTGTGDVPDTVFATGSASAPSVPWKDPQGNTAKFTRLISESGETTGSVAARAQLQLNRFNRTTTALKVTADQFEIRGTFDVGDATYVYDPDTGVVNPALEVFFRGEVLHPDIVRVSERTWPIVEGMTVAWRTDAGVWLDLTPWVVWETTGTHELTVGDLPKTLLKSSQPNGGVQDRVDAAAGIPSTKVPKTPAGLTLSTSSTANAKGRDSAVITASWSAVTQYVDNATVALHHYEVQYRPQFRSPAWTGSVITSDLAADLPVTAALGYDVQVRAVSTGGVASAWSTSASIVSAADSTGPATPSDPVVSQYLGLLRIYWNGLTSTGTAMPSDFNRVDVHVGTTSGFTASAATLVSSLSAAGYAHAQAPYGSARFVRFIAYDHNGNPSSSSATVSGTTVQAADGDVAALNVGKLVSGTMSADVVTSGRFTTALTGARREVNAVGFQAFDASNNLLINLDGVNNLLTGLFQTALPGNRRIVIGAAGATGAIDFFAPDGTQARIAATTSSVGTVGVETLNMRIVHGISTIWTGWGGVQVETNAQMYFLASKAQFMIGGDGPEAVKEFRLSWADDRGTATTAPTRNARLVVVRDTSTFYLPLAANGGVDGHFLIRRGISPSSAAYWYSAADGVHHFYGTSEAQGRVEIYPNIIVDSNFRTPQIKLITDTTGYGGVLKFIVRAGGVSPAFQFRDVNDSVYYPLEASAFTVSSDMAGKDEIADIAFSPLEKVRTIRPRSFVRKRDDGIKAQTEYGFVAQEVPAEMRAGVPGDLGVDLAAGLMLALGSIRELATAVDELKKVKA